MEKIIIIEGEDNCGKDTLIKNLKLNFKNKSVKVLHYTKSAEPGKDNDETIHIWSGCNAEENKNAAVINSLIFEGLASKILEFSDYDIIIINRCYYSEYVYGSLYRGRRKDDIIEMIHKSEKNLKEAADALGAQVSLIMLHSSSHDIIANNEDGDSISAGDIKKIEKEAELFHEVYNLAASLDHQGYIDVSKNGKFINPDDICFWALMFIYCDVKFVH